MKPLKDSVCMRFPLSVACHLDNAHGRHDAMIDWRCRLHEALLTLTSTVWVATHPKAWG